MTNSILVNPEHESFLSAIFLNRSWIFLLSIFVWGCSSSTNNTETWVAKWENYKVPTTVFKTQYVSFTSSSPVQDSEETRKDFARYVLEQIIIAEQAKQNQLDTLTEVRKQIDLQRKQALRKHFVRSIIDKRIDYPSESEVYEAFERKNSELKLEQIFAATQQEIDSLQQLLKQGVPFEKLARASMQRHNSALPDSSFKMGWVKAGQMDLDIENLTFSMKEKTISEPVQSFNGWHIFRLDAKRKTTFLDATSFANDRESLAANLYKRRFEEESKRYIDSVLQTIPLAIPSSTLKEVWAVIAPWVNRANSQNVNKSILLNLDANAYVDGPIPRSTPIASVDGNPFTFGQFLDQLPTLPFFLLQPNLVEAVQFAIKDSIFAARGALEGFEEHPEVQKEVFIAKTAALYYAQLRNTYESLDFSSLEAIFYEKLKPTYFVDSVETKFEALVFIDSVKAWKAIRHWQTNRSYSKLKSEFVNSFKQENRVSKHAWDKRSAHPEHNIPLKNNEMDQVFSGPYKEGSQWVLYAPLARYEIHKPYEKVKERLQELMRQNASQISHEQSLPTNYRLEAINYNKTLIDTVLPYYFQ
jgi:hypothetical protein